MEDLQVKDLTLDARRGEKKSQFSGLDHLQTSLLLSSRGHGNFLKASLIKNTF